MSSAALPGGLGVKAGVFAGVLASMLGVAGCSQLGASQEISSQGTTGVAPENASASFVNRAKVVADPAQGSLPGLTGVWRVVGHHVPGISAMGHAEAATWHGRMVRLTATQAFSEGNHCDEPSYVTRSEPRDLFLATEFKLPPGSLAPLESVERLTLLEVYCADERWAAMGGLLIAIDATHALTPWDGVFFELARDGDFRATGQEPAPEDK